MTVGCRCEALPGRRRAHADRACPGCSIWLRKPTPTRCSAKRGVALIFEKPSNRTRNSTEMAVVELGGHPVTMRGEEIGLGNRESVADVVTVLARYHRVVCARVFRHSVLDEMAAVDAVPVVNLLSDKAHPVPGAR